MSCHYHQHILPATTIILLKHIFMKRKKKFEKMHICPRFDNKKFYPIQLHSLMMMIVVVIEIHVFVIHFRHPVLMAFEHPYQMNHN